VEKEIEIKRFKGRKRKFPFFDIESVQFLNFFRNAQKGCLSNLSP
jgi:hypothetical protein